MSKRTLCIISVVLLALLLAACGTPSSAPAPTSTPQSIAPQTATPPMSLADAKQIASQSACAQAGTLQDTAVYNSNSNTWWIDLKADKPNCNPACVVDVKAKTAEVNWRCTGAVVPTDTPQSGGNAPNPASENCVKQGGMVSIQKNSDGSEYGLCVFPAGKQCEEWAMQRGECPVGGIPVAGRYTAQLPAADAIGRVVVLDLLPDSTATLTTQFIGKGAPTVDKGTWAQPGKNIVITIDSPASEKQTLAFQYNTGKLVLQDAAKSGYGADGLTLTRTPSGQTNTAEFGGVKIAFDAQLAKSAQGENVAAVPVSEGPALGGASPAAIRFLLDGATAPDYLDPHLTQVLVYKADEWAQLDPSIAQNITALKTLLAAKPSTIAGSIPVLPPIPAAQVFHVKPQYLNFKNGTGVGFITYYAQDVSPVMASGLFYTFQGLTNDGQYYVAVFGPAMTALLPTDPTAAMGGQSYDEWAKNYETYLADLVAQLNGLLPAAYTPDLTLIDELVKSIEVGVTSTSTGGQIANPASVNCTKQGGQLVIQKRGDGGEYGICVFEDNRQCEEWALLNGECPVGGLKVTGYVTPAAQYCAITGGTYTVTGNSNTPNETGTCTFKNGQTCDAGDYYNGKCSLNTAPIAEAIQPLPAEVCNGQAQAMAHTLNVVEVTQANAPLSDPSTGASGTGCQATVTGTGKQFQSPDAVVNALGGMLKDQGWTEDQMLAAGGPTGMGAGYRKGDQMCMVLAEWQPDASANCSKDQPISACQVTPEQQLYTITLNCGVEASAK
jgi:putative hemolysin